MSTSTREAIFGRDIEIVRAGRLAVPFLILAGWWILTQIIGATVLPGPVDTALGIISGVENGWVTVNLVDTLTAVVTAFCLAVILGLLTGMVLGLNKFFYDTFEIYILSSYAVPKIIFFPIFLFIFELGLQMKVAYATLSGFFPMLIITMSAIRGVDDIYLELAYSYQLNWLQKLRHVIVPFTLVQLVVAIRFAFSLTFLGVILVELIASKSGLGLVLQQSMRNFNTGRIMVAVAVLMIIAAAINIIFYFLQRRLEDRWNINADVGGI